MKIKIIITCLLLVCAGCGKKNRGAGDSLRIPDRDQLDQTYPADRSHGSLEFDAEEDWAAGVYGEETTGVEGRLNWIGLSRYYGEPGSHSLTIILDRNLTGSDRTARVRIVSPSAELTATVTQLASTADGSVPEIKMVRTIRRVRTAPEGVTETTISIEYNADKQVVGMKSDGPGGATRSWTYTYRGNSVTVTSSSGGAESDRKATVQLTEDHRVGTGLTITEDGRRITWATDYREDYLTRIAYLSTDPADGSFESWNFDAQWENGNLSTIATEQRWTETEYNPDLLNPEKMNMDFNWVVNEGWFARSADRWTLAAWDGYGQRSRNLVRRSCDRYGDQPVATAEHLYSWSFDEEGCVASATVSIPEKNETISYQVEYFPSF